LKSGKSYHRVSELVDRIADVVCEGDRDGRDADRYLSSPGQSSFEPQASGVIAVTKNEQKADVSLKRAAANHNRLARRWPNHQKSGGLVEPHVN
jgi:hypothetical protein